MQAVIDGRRGTAGRLRQRLGGSRGARVRRMRSVGASIIRPGEWEAARASKLAGG